MAYIDSVATSTSKYTDKKVDASITNLGTTYEGRTMKMLKLAVQVRRENHLFLAHIAMFKLGSKKCLCYVCVCYVCIPSCDKLENNILEPIAEPKIGKFISPDILLRFG